MRTELAFLAEDKLFEATSIDAVPVGVDRRSRPVRLRYTRTGLSDRGGSRHAVELAANTGLGQANDLSSYQSEYAGISQVRWWALRGEAEWWRTLPPDWGVLVRANYQLASTALISGEQFGLGGVGSVRGVRTERPLSGDHGVALTAELSAPLPLEGLRAFSFVDAGWIANHAADGIQRLPSDGIAGAGFGLRFSNLRVSASAEYGRLVRGSRLPAALHPDAPTRGDGRLYMSFGLRF